MRKTIELFVNNSSDRVTLKYLGEGNTVVCYKDTATGEIYKEFFPRGLATEGKLMRGEDGVVRLSDGVTEQEAGEIEKEYSKFLKMEELPYKISQAYKNINATMILAQRIVDSSLGKLYYCPYVGGDLLKNYIEKEIRPLKSFSEKLTKVFSFEVKLLKDLSVYHNNGYVNFDVKEENLWCVNVDKDDHTAIRNLDFGSCLSLNCLKTVAKNGDVSTVTLTETYYDGSKIRSLLDDGASDSQFKALDILACFRLALVSLYDKGRKGYEKRIDGREYQMRKNIDSAILKEIFITATENPKDRKETFCLYSVYYELSRILKELNSERVEISCEKVCERLQRLLDFMAGINNAQTFVMRKNVENAVTYLPPNIDFQDLCFKSFMGESPCSLARIVRLFVEENLRIELFPNVACRGNVYSLQKSDGRIPLLQFYYDVKKNGHPLRCVLKGDGGLGKSVSARLLNVRLLEEGIPCLLYKCKDIRREEDFEDVKKAPSNTLIIIDAFDEWRFSDKSSFERCLALTDKDFLITSRFSLISGREERSETNPYGDFKEISLCELSDDVVDGYLEKEGLSEDFYGCRDLLKNTMFMAMLCETGGFSKEVRKGVKDEASFMRAYFYHLYKNKSLDDEEDCLLKSERHCRLIGERIAMDSYLEYVEVDPSLKREYMQFSEECETLFDWLGSNRTLRGIVVVKEDNGVKRLDFSHCYYKEFFLACYLRSQILGNGRYWCTKKSMGDKSEQIKKFEYLFRYYGESVEAELHTLDMSKELAEIYGLEGDSFGSIKETMLRACYLCGQMLQNEAKEALLSLKKLETFNSWKAKSKVYLNLIYLGSSNGVITAEDVNEFGIDIVTPQEESFSYVKQIRTGRVIPNILKKLFIPPIFGAVNNIRVIEFSDSQEYETVNNCVIDKKSKTLLLGSASKGDLIIDKGVRAIGEYAFTGCNALKSVSVLKGVSSIGSNAFHLCEGLQSVRLGDCVEKIEHGAFSNCKNLSDVTLSLGVKVIGDAGFLGCIALKEIEVPDSVEIIQARAFAFCKNLEVVKLSKGLKIISSNTFAGCYNLKKVIFKDKDDWIEKKYDWDRNEEVSLITDNDLDDGTRVAERFLNSSESFVLVKKGYTSRDFYEELGGSIITRN